MSPHMRKTDEESGVRVSEQHCFRTIGERRGGDVSCSLSIVAFSTCWWERKAEGAAGGQEAGRTL